MQFPEHAKLDKIKGQSQAIGEFLDWLRNERGRYAPQKPICLAEADEFGDLAPANITTDQLLAEYFEIDPVRLEAEKREMLALTRGERLPETPR